jgi:hypothetical protein
MQQNELAQLLNISPAMVSRLAKRGMPTDDLLRAQRWRKRHLDPGRIKGSRFNPNQPTKPTATRPATATPAAAVLPCVPPAVLDFEIEAAGDLVDAALIVGNLYGGAYRTMQLRHLLRQTADDASPRLSLRVWLALLDYTLHETSAMRFALNMGAVATPGEIGALACPADPWPAHAVLFQACDVDDDAVNGFPEYPDDPQWLEMMTEERAANKALRCSRVFGGGGYPLPPEWQALMTEA